MTKYKTILFLKITLILLFAKINCEGAEYPFENPLNNLNSTRNALLEHVCLKNYYL